MKRIVFIGCVVVLLFAVAVLVISFPSGEMGEGRFVSFANTTPPPNQTVTPTLTVAPLNGLTSWGPIGGPFLPESIVYTLTNTSGSYITWRAEKTQPWITLSASGGMLVAGQTVLVKVSLNSNANSLDYNKWEGWVLFKNLTNGSGDGGRPVYLTVSTGDQLSIVPSSGFTSTGPIGGPFVPPRIFYRLTNQSRAAISWRAEKTQPWITLSASGGMLVGGQTKDIEVSININANSLAANTYKDLVIFKNLTNMSAIRDATRPVSLMVK